MKNNTLEQGQSTIEFIVSFVFGVSIVFMVFNSALNYTTGYLVHYATFMASRVYLVSDNGTGNIQNPDSSMSFAEEDTRETYQKYRLDIFQIGTDKFELNPINGNATTTEEYITVGTRTTFEQSIDAVGKILGQSKLELVSESFLGHEPSRAQCANRTCVGITNGEGCSNEMDITLFDNGC
jgi:hypothetical protein